MEYCGRCKKATLAQTTAAADAGADAPGGSGGGGSTGPSAADALASLGRALFHRDRAVRFPAAAALRSRLR